MKILAIHDGHNASTCYFCNGEIKYLLQEERFTNVKNQGGFPEKSLEWLMRQADFNIVDVDFISIGCFDLPVYNEKTKNDIFHKLLFLGQTIIPKKIISSELLIRPYLTLAWIKRRKQLRDYAEKYGLDYSRITQVEHHMSHGYAALYGSGFVYEKDQVLIFTIDNAGDGLSSTVSKWESGKGYTRIHENQAFNSLGELYGVVTEYLGMKRHEHEYKLMGMAPYVSDEYSEDIFQLLKEKYIDLDQDGLKFINKAAYGRHLLSKLKKDFFKKRFDNICAGVQRHYEYLVLNWITNWAQKTGIKRAVFGGGCFMNVKANMLISQLDIFDKLFFMPSAGDESTSIGSAYKVCEDNTDEPIATLGHLYKGPAFTNLETEKILQRYADKVLYEKKEDIEETIVDLLIDYKIVGRLKGSTEWGARALGNRSILCRADDLGIIHKLNKSIKMRDFWMPFASSILEEDADKYIINPNRNSALYMMMTFPTKELAHKHIAAGLHPFDFTCRPQLVKREWSPDFHKMLVYFKERTGISGILNTSFNLHGFPIVGSPDDAITTLIDSNLDYIAIEDYLIWTRKEVQPIIK